MSSITIKDLPAALHAALRARAQTHGRSLNREVIRLLEAGVAPGGGGVREPAATYGTPAPAGPRFVYWQAGAWWLGYIEEYPDYRTQGRTLDELRDNLRDVLHDLAGGVIPGARRVAELEPA